MITRHFGFSENPFNPTPDPRYLFLTESHNEALASMVYGIKEKKGFVCITGEIGTGKTTLIRHLLNTLDPTIKPVLINQTLVSFEELLRELLLELDLPLNDERKTTLIRQLNSYLIERFAQNETVVVVVDEAQHLDRDALEGLRLLSNLETERCKLIQIVLVGQPELEEKLSTEGLRQLGQRVGIWRHLKPLTEQESRDYIQHRLRKVGSSLEEVFTPEAIHLICQYARGIPRVVNILCDNALLIGYALLKKRIDVNIIEEVLDDMGMRSAGKQAGRKIAGREVEHVTRPEPSTISPVDKPVRGMIVSGDRETPADQGTKATFAKMSTGRSRKYKRTAMFVLLVLSLVGNVFLVKRNLHYFSKKILPAPPSPFRSIQVNHSDESKHEPRIKRIITVERGETISILARRYYGISSHTVMDHILTVNREITNPHQIREHQTIMLPEITEDSLIIQARDGKYGIWLETFPNAAEAESLSKELSLIDKKIEVLPRPVSPNETWYRATTGFFETREACVMAIQRMRMKGILSALEES